MGNIDAMRAILTDDFLVRFVLAALATWRVTHLLANEDGPADIVFRLRRRLGDSPIGGLMDCFNCLSLWVAIPATFFLTTQPVVWAVSWVALSGAACLLQRLGEKRPTGPEAQSAEGDNDVLR
jgi:hypothetical protein